MSTAATAADGEGRGGRSAQYGEQHPSTWVSGARYSRDDNNLVSEPADNAVPPPPPISGQIPSPTGGIHSYQTEDRLRHRSLITTPTRHSGYFPDDADIAAGSRPQIISKCLSEPRPTSLSRSLPHETLRNRATSFRTEDHSSSLQ